MKIVFWVVLTLLEYVASFIVGYYGITYTFIAGPVFLGPVAGVIVPSVIVLLFVLYVLKKEGATALLMRLGTESRTDI